jgi:hypothetical protein
MMALNDALNGRIDHLLARARLAAIFRMPAIYPSLILSKGAIRSSTMADVQRRTHRSWLRQPNLFRSDLYATSASQMPSWHSAGG